MTLLKDLRNAQGMYLKTAKKSVRELYKTKLHQSEDELKQIVENEEGLAGIKAKRQVAAQKLDEKIAIATQIYDLVDHHIRRLDSDLSNYECLLKQNGEYDEEELTRKIDPPTSAEVAPLKKKTTVGRKRVSMEEVPAPSFLAKAIEEPVIDPNEPIYCTCRRVPYGHMIACDNEGCFFEWFHYECLGLNEPLAGIWFCVACKAENPEGFKKAVAQEAIEIAVAEEKALLKSSNSTKSKSSIKATTSAKAKALEKKKRSQ